MLAEVYFQGFSQTTLACELVCPEGTIRWVRKSDHGVLVFISGLIGLESILYRRLKVIQIEIVDLCLVYEFVIPFVVVSTSLQRCQTFTAHGGFRKGSRWFRSSRLDIGTVGDLSSREMFTLSQLCGELCVLLPNLSCSENKELCGGRSPVYL